MCRLDVAMGDIENNTFDRKDNTKKCFISRTWLISVLVVFFFVAPFVQRDDSDSLHHGGVKSASVGFPGEASFETNKQERDSIPEHKARPTMNTELHDSWEPLEAFNRWKVWHSQQALEEEYRAHKRKGLPLPERKFVVAQYSCPEQAGNLLHNFANALLLAVVTNRTLTYEYRTTTSMFVKQNSKSKCDTILRRADWLPPSSVWSRRYNLGNGGAKVNSDHVVIKPDLHKTKHLLELYQEDPSVRLVSQNTTRLNQEARMWTFSKLYHLNEKMDGIWDGLVNMQDSFGYSFFAQLLGFEGNVYSQEVVPLLWTHGTAFLYGMLFRESFSFTTEIQQSVDHYILPSSLDTADDQLEPITIALHSRHPKPNFDGSDISAELQCLEEVLSKLRRKEKNHNAPCTLLIMSDRVKTLEALEAAAPDYQCSVIHVSAEGDLTALEGANAEIQEHGPFAGAGFFRDWLVVSQARSAMISGYRSSSALVYELMTYDGMLEGSITEKPLRCTTF